MDKKLILIPVVLLLLAILQAGRYGAASMYAIKPHEALEEWSAHGVEPDPPEIEEGLERLDTAISLDPKDPSYLEDMARLYVLKAKTTPQQKEIYLRKALALIRKAVEMRPVSPYSWGSLLFVKSELGEIDPEFFRALSNATFLGPWEPEVQIEVARAGMENWDRMNFEQKEEVRKDIARAMKWHADDLKQIVLAGKCGNCR